MVVEEMQFTDIRKKLVAINAEINAFLQKNEAGWYRLHEKIPELVAPLDFPTLIDSCPHIKPYFRFPVIQEGMLFCLTLFVFRQEAHPGAVVLLHTYADSSPNGNIYHPEDVSNLKHEVSDKFIQLSTPIHSHTVKCHSYVAWAHGSVSIREQVYSQGQDGLFLKEDRPRPVGSTSFDDSCGDYIHSISVRFNKMS